MNKYIMGVLIALGASFAIAAEAPKEAPKKEEKNVCVKTEDIQKVMNDKGYFTLLNMTNKNKVIETVWIAGTTVVITAQDDKDSCVLAMLDDVVYNPDTLQGLLKAYESQQKKQKDI